MSYGSTVSSNCAEQDFSQIVNRIAKKLNLGVYELSDENQIKNVLGNLINDVWGALVIITLQGT